MEKYEELLRKKADIEAKLEEARAREIADTKVTVKVKDLISPFNLKPQDFFGTKAVRRVGKSGGKVEPKFRNPATSETWAGRCKAPRWIQDQDRTKFLIK
ncbi:MAG: H-NS histone family protein [Candidatus Protistobacter heckmanni]|nr:H-NS histone family protein [Candidatus Protistobacter heckmanni]